MKLSQVKSILKTVEAVNFMDTAEGFRLVEQYFGAIARGAIERPPLLNIGLPSTMGGWQREQVEDDVKVPRLFLAFRSPPFCHEGYYAASTCAALLGNGKSSRLQQQLVRDQEVAMAVSAFTFDLSTGADLLVLDITARPGVSAEQLEAAAVAEVDRLATDGVDSVDLARAQTLVTTELTASMQSAQARADKLSQFATYTGDAGGLNAHVPNYRAVTVAQLNQAAAQILGSDNRVSLVYVPRTGAAA